MKAPGGFGWESNLIAYRTYCGKIGIFEKKVAECKKIMEEAENMQKIVGERARFIPPAGIYNTLVSKYLRRFAHEIF